MKDLAERIIALRKGDARLTQLRVEAEASHSMAKTQLAQIERTLREMGINPENADQELEALEAQLTVMIEAAQTSISDESKAYTEFIDRVNEALRS